MKLFAFWRVALTGAIFILPMSAWAQQTAAVVIPDVSPATIAAFKADPAAFAKEIVAAKGDLAGTLAGLLVKDPTLLTEASPGKPSLFAQARQGTPDESKSFVKALSEAAHSFVAAQQKEKFTDMQTAVVLQFDSAFQTDFTNAIADIRTTALGSSSGGGGGSINGSQNGGPNSQPANFASETAKNSGPGSPQVGVTSGSASSSGTGTNTNTTTTRTVNVSVSPSGLVSF
jgi:hypothetical protein